MANKDDEVIHIVYKATNPKVIILLSLLLLTIAFSTEPAPLAMSALFASVALFCVLALFVTYEFRIDEETLTYRMRLFGFKVYGKTAGPDEIEAVVFKRANWKTKHAIVKVKSGWNMRILLFQPANVFADLENFVARHGVEVQKSSDYRILEKMT